MTQTEFKEYIKGKKIAHVELDTINQYRGYKLDENKISITELFLTDGTKITFEGDAFIEKITLKNK